ncbi:MAG: Gfo/Idh/MocA family oxidoreductase [Kiritimatiellae bacterium]|nr:Gfo/Idh/MocA family oxidoreductase [Kiritimatiellia bacterium]
MTNVALVGCAHIHTPNFVKRLKERTDVRVTMVWDHDEQRAKKNAEQLGTRAVESPEIIWESSDICGVIICSETNRHEELVLAACQAGKHLFVEKPLGIGATDAWRMARAIRSAGVMFQTGYFLRGTPVHRFLREKIAQGTFGTITRARHSNCHAGSLKGWFNTDWRWMADPAIAGCGAFGDLGTHSLDILMWFFGDVARVTASINMVTGRYGECDESGEGLIEFQNGVVATLAAGWVDIDNPVRLLISGTRAHACVIGDQLFFKCEAVEGADGKTPWTKLPAPQPHAFDLFLDALTGKADASVLVSPEEAAARCEVMEAFYRAHEGHKWVEPRKE